MRGRRWDCGWRTGYGGWRRSSLDKSSQTVARWEKDQVRIDGPADRLLRLLYEKHAGGRSRIRTLLQRLAELDSGIEEQIQFEDTEKGWQLHIAA